MLTYYFKFKHLYIIVRLNNAHLLLVFNAKKHPKQYKNQYTYVTIIISPYFVSVGNLVLNKI